MCADERKRFEESPLVRKVRQEERLLIPGPTPVPPRVLEAAARHPIGHRTSELSGYLASATEGLKWLASTKSDVFVLTASGTAGMDAAVSNSINAGDRVLSLVCGVFGERFARIAEAYGASVERLQVPFGQGIEVDRVKEVLAADTGREIKAVTVTHNETSTGVLNDLEAIAAVVRAHGALILVDAVTSLGATPVEMDAWGLDVVVSGSQKALMLPPGLSVVYTSQRFWSAYERCKTPRFYLDLGRYRKSLEKDTTPFTPAVTLVRALAEGLAMLQEEGKEAVYARHEKMRARLRAGIRERGLDLLVEDRFASPSVTSIIPPDGVAVAEIRSELKKTFGLIVADGQESLKGKIFRIGHMGYVFERDIALALTCLDETLAGMRSPLATGKH